MNNETKKNGWGGTRSGAGRPVGATAKTRVSTKEILDTAHAMLGKPFIVSLMEGYMATIASGNTRDRIQYEKVILDKTASTVVEADITTTTADNIAAKQLAFSEALQKLIAKSEQIEVN
jgi:hypothetical protein